MEGDRHVYPRSSHSFKISIHSLRMEGDRLQDKTFRIYASFQSTPSAWRETTGTDDSAARLYISIHSLRMEGDSSVTARHTVSFISIHSLRMEGDENVHNPDRFGEIISIHSLRMEGDQNSRRITRTILAFQSTPSAWRETLRPIIFSEDFIFQSTPSAWRETLIAISLHTPFVISIHSLRMEGDR